MSPELTVSAVIPAWCEARTIEDAVAGAFRVADEVVVVDAGSPDGTAALAASAGARLIQAPKGRGAQLAAGAAAATGDVLLFVHADARLAPNARPAILEALSDPRVLAGNFLLRFEPPTRAARFFSWANDVRRRWLRIYYGDSGLFVRRAAYLAAGGIRPSPLFEDYDLVRRLERLGRTAYLRDVVIRVSARRFERAPIRTLLLWTALQVLYSAGVSPERLSALYRDLR